MNDWQRVYEGTRHVTTAALLTVTRLRLAVALDKVSEDQVQEALAGGGDSIGALLEATEAPAAHAGLEEFAEAVDYSFSPFGRLI